MNPWLLACLWGAVWLRWLSAPQGPKHVVIDVDFRARTWRVREEW